MKTNSIDRNISIRISILRYVMIIGVVILHLPPNIYLLNTGPGAFPFVKAFFAHAVFRSTVPVLTCISGYLLFFADLDTKIPMLLIRKVKRLLIPLFIWNFPIVLILYVLQSQGFFFNHNHYAKMYPFDPVTFINGTFSFTQSLLNSF